MSLEIQLLSSLLLTSANKRQIFFTSRVLFWSFFPKSCLKVLGAAYTRVFTVHPSTTNIVLSLKVLTYLLNYNQHTDNMFSLKYSIPKYKCVP